jgi:hypothetical protein
MGGTNDKENLVNLTAREHFICHKLLVEIYPNNNKLVFGLWRMTIPSQAERYKIDSRQYERIRILYTNTVRVNLSGKKVVMTENRIKSIDRRRGKPGRALTAEAKKKISSSLKGKCKGIAKPPRTKEHVENLSRSLKGKAPHNKGKKKFIDKFGNITYI